LGSFAEEKLQYLSHESFEFGTREKKELKE